jgi:uncharacterized protein YukE
MKHTTALTTEYRNRVQESIKETERLISKENGVSFELRYHDKVRGWENHLTKLKGYLEAGEIVSVIPE